MHDRGKRIESERRILKQRVRRAKLNLIGISPKFERQPHRLDKVRANFTHQRGSLKEDKQLANRAARSRVRDALKSGEEPLPEPKNSVRLELLVGTQSQFDGWIQIAHTLP